MALVDRGRGGITSDQSELQLQSTPLSPSPYPQSAHLTASATSSQQGIPLHEIERRSNGNQSVAHSLPEQPGTVIEDRAPSNRTVRCASQRKYYAQ